MQRNPHLTPIKSRGVSRTKCKQRFTKPSGRKAVSSKVRVFNLRDQMNLPATDSEE